MISFKPLFYLSLVVISLLGCYTGLDEVEFQKQGYFYSNTEGNNTIEGTHIYIKKKLGDTLFFDANSTKIVQNLNLSWVAGQGSGKPYYDTGKEYYWQIIKVLPELNAVITNPVSEYFNINNPIVFWKPGPYPIHFSDSLKGSWGFSKILFDSKDSTFKTHLFECDTDVVNLYMASSKDLGKWTIKHLLSPEEFNGLSWNAPAANGKMKVTPLISDVIYFNNQFYSFAYGDDADEKTYISVLTSPSLDGPYTIQKDPILSPNPKSKFSNHDVYFPKVVRFKDSWLMYYTAKNESKEEFICLAQSSDLKTWKTVKENIIPRNNGWNSGLSNQLCAQVKIKDNQIHIWATGIKDVGDYSQPNKGNAMDECIGEFYSSTPGSGFIEAPGNPIFGGNPTFDFENDHIGGAFQELIHEGYKYTFYHGKGRTSKNYTILVK